MKLYFDAVYPLRAYPPSFQEQILARGLRWPGPPDDRRLEDGWDGRPGIDLETFKALAEDAKDNCPVSVALKGNVDLVVDASLV